MLAKIASQTFSRRTHPKFLHAIVNTDGNYMQSVDSFLYLGNHLTVIVGQRLCATLGPHHRHHHHYISSDVSSEQSRPWVHYNISAITKKIWRMMSSLYTPYLKGQVPLEHSKPNYVSSKYWSYQSFCRWPRPGLAWPPT